MIAPARVAAYRALSAVSAGRSTLSDALASARATLHDERDRALAADIALGVQRWKAALEHGIAQVAKRPLSRLDPEVVEILRMGAYQLLYLTRVPASAVVNDAVALTRQSGKRSAAGFVNAVLRRIADAGGAPRLPPRPHDPVPEHAALDYLSITLSHPRWLVSRWYRRYGFEVTERWLRFNNEPAPLTLRVNRLRITPEELIGRLREEGVTVTNGRFAPDALVVRSGNPLRGAGPEAGWFVVQDEASQLIALVAARDVGTRALDACASPGGKTTALAAGMKGEGLLVACDVRDRRMSLLQRTVNASGAHNVRLVRADMLHPLPFSAAFSTVLVDAPCSGLGTLRRDPDIRWRRREDELVPLAEHELIMLRHAADAVAPGGRLIYATCSSEPEENESVVDRFLADARQFEAVDLRTADTRVPPVVIDARGHLRTLPHAHGLEAFFAAAFTRRS
jgi:16S rRNA (cytosine967-C5)-methyltransferase